MYGRKVHAAQKNLINFFVLTVFFFVVCCCGELERPLEFPFDHGPHFNVENEWWYFTGEVLTIEGKRLGFEYTIFKRWVAGINDFAYLGHLAVSNPETSEHLFDEVATLPPVSGIEEGKADMEINSFSYSFSESGVFIIKAEAGNISVDLSLTPAMDVLPHGEDGIIVMGDGMNSYYYSFTNLMTEGNISVDGDEYVVASGRTWMDHQWGNFTSFGLFWDWFSLRLDDGSALMLFQHRDIFDNAIRSNWTYRSVSGSVEYGEESSVQATRIYDDVHGNCTCPVDWIVEVPGISAEFMVRPLFDGQCLYDILTPNYWEGLCSVEGTIDGETVTGSACVELTGYDN